MSNILSLSILRTLLTMYTSSTDLFILTVFCLVILTNNVYSMENLMGSEIQECLNCLCHARSGCWDRLNCASYSISKDYWKIAGSHSIGFYSNSDKAFKACMKHENCILNTIKTYTESFGKLDCNCDGVFDCKDRFAIHLFGQECTNPAYGQTYADRFNECAENIGVSPMSEIEGDCEPETFN